MLLWIMSAMADCGLQDLDATIASIEDAFAEMSDGFAPLRSRFQERVECLTEPLDPGTAARVHRTSALFSFFDDDEKTTRLYFARYRELMPRGVLPERLAPRDHPLQKLFDVKVRPDDGPLPEPSEGWLLVDGEQSTDAPRNLPFVLQHVADNGDILATGLVPAKGELPFYARKEPVAPPPEPSVQPVKTPRTRPVNTNSSSTTLKPVSVAGIAIAGLGLISYTAAWGSRSSYFDAVRAGDKTKIDRNHRATNGLTVTGLGLMGVGGGLVVAGVL